jgi:hypothetical protein
VLILASCTKYEYISPEEENDGLDIMLHKYPNLDASVYPGGIIDLSNCNLTSVNYRICNYANMAQLFLTKNLLTQLPDSIHHIGSLGVLVANFNYIHTFPESFYKLKNLG